MYKSIIPCHGKKNKTNKCWGQWGMGSRLTDFLFILLNMQAMRVHPDKNMGSPLASESFKKLQCAYEVSIHTESLSLT
jgi:hypothetical protein